MSTTINNNELGSSVRSKLNNNLATSERNAGTGLIKDCVVSALVGGTTFDVGAGILAFKTVDVNGNPTYSEKAFSGVTGVTVSGLGISAFTWLTIDSSLQVKQYTSQPSASVFETEVYIDKIVHFDLTNPTIQAPATVRTPIAAWKHDEFISIWKNGAQSISGNGADVTAGTGLQFEKAGGVIERAGGFFDITPDSPNLGTVPSVLFGTALSTRTRSAVTGYTVEAQTGVDPNNYDAGGGTLSPVPNNDWINLYFWNFAQSDGVTYTTGPTTYQTSTGAKNAIGTEKAPAFDILNEAAPLYVFTIQQGTTTMVEDTNVFITPFSRKGTVISTGGGAGGGESNTASNVGTAGVGLYKQKVGQNLEFKKVNAGSSKVTITDDTGNSEVDIDVDPSQIATSTLNNDAGFVTNGGLVGTKAVDEAAIGDDKIIVYKTGTDNFVYEAKPAAGGGSSDAFDAYFTGSQNITTTATIVQFNTENYDDGGNFDTTTYLYTAPTAGKYLFHSCLKATGFTASDILQILFYKNGSTYMGDEIVRIQSDNTSISATITADLAANDTMEVRVANQIASRGAINNGNTTTFTGFKIY